MTIMARAPKPKPDIMQMKENERSVKMGPISLMRVLPLVTRARPEHIMVVTTHQNVPLVLKIRTPIRKGIVSVLHAPGGLLQAEPGILFALRVRLEHLRGMKDTTVSHVQQAAMPRRRGRLLVLPVLRGLTNPKPDNPPVSRVQKVHMGELLIEEHVKLVQMAGMLIRKEVFHVKGVPPGKRPTQTIPAVNRRKFLVC